LFDDFHTRPVFDYDMGAAEEFQRLRKQRVRIGTMDLRIAAIALSQDALLISRNLTDLRKVPGLRVEDWTQ
jgi:tRNA(fMet)-specific endonuclease VapC